MSDANQRQAAQDDALAKDVQTSPPAGDELAKLRAEAAEGRDRALRAQAELENYRKRARRDMEEERRYANFPLLADLLSVIDNVGRAIEGAEQVLRASEAEGSGQGLKLNPMLAGLKIVAESFENTLSKYGCTKIPALHQPFDPHKHQAIMQQPSDQVPPGAVLAVAQDGYQLHDRVLRPAQVIVSTGKSG